MSEEDLSYEELKQQVEELQYGIETLDDDLDMKTRENEQLQEAAVSLRHFEYLFHLPNPCIRGCE